MTLRDRFFTKPVAEAIMSPSGIALAGVGVAVGVVAGVPVVGAAAIGLAAWGARVALAVPRGGRGSSATTRSPRVERRRLTGEWQGYFDEAIAARQRFEAAVQRTRPGAVQDRLAGMSPRIDEFVEHSSGVAWSGQQLAEARAMVDTDRITRDLAAIELGRAPAPGSAQAQAAEALRAQLDSARRLDDTIATARSRLIMLDARLDELVTRAIELSVTGADAGSLGSVESDLVDVVDALEAVRLAVEETG